MASLEEINFNEADVLATADSAAGAAVTATAPTTTTGFKYIVTAICISATGAPAAAVGVEMRADTGGAIRFPLRLPAAAYAPIFINFAQTPLGAYAAGKRPELFVPAHGGAVVVTATIFGRKVRA
jgi:hypothetical protein